MNEDRPSAARSPLIFPSAQIGPNARPPALTFDAAAYQEYVEHYALTSAQKSELLAAIWTTMVQFVDLGFGLHPVQLCVDKKTLEPDSLAVLVCEETSINLSGGQSEASTALALTGDKP